MAEISMSASCRSSPFIVLRRGKEIVGLHDIVARSTDRVQQLLKFPKNLPCLFDDISRRGDLAGFVGAGGAGQPDHFSDTQGRHIGILRRPWLSACDGLADFEHQLFSFGASCCSTR